MHPLPLILIFCVALCNAGANGLIQPSEAAKLMHNAPKIVKAVVKSQEGAFLQQFGEAKRQQMLTRLVDERLAALLQLEDEQQRLQALKRMSGFVQRREHAK